MNSVKEIDIKNCTHYDVINIKTLYPNKIKIDRKSNKNIFTYYISYKKTNSVKFLYIIINRINGYIEESKENKYLTLVPTDKSKDTLNKYEK